MTVRLLTSLQPLASLLLSSLAILFLAGCNSGKAVYPVSGTVNFEGKPMAGKGSITFIPVQTEGGRMAGGEVLEDGTYKLTTVKEGDGAMAGEYRVAITQVTSVEPVATPDGEAPPPVTAALTPDQLIPAIYADHTKTPLTVTVKAGPNQDLNFELKRSGQ